MRFWCRNVIIPKYQRTNHMIRTSQFDSYNNNYRGLHWTSSPVQFPVHSKPSTDRNANELFNELHGKYMSIWICVFFLSLFSSSSIVMQRSDADLLNTHLKMRALFPHEIFWTWSNIKIEFINIFTRNSDSNSSLSIELKTVHAFFAFVWHGFVVDVGVFSFNFDYYFPITINCVL